MSDRMIITLACKDVARCHVEGWGERRARISRAPDRVVGNEARAKPRSFAL